MFVLIDNFLMRVFPIGCHCVHKNVRRVAGLDLPHKAYVLMTIMQTFTTTIAYPHGLHPYTVSRLGQGHCRVGKVSASAHMGMVTVVVSAIAGAGEGGLATDERFLESEKKWELKQFVTGIYDCARFDVTIAVEMK